VKDAPTEELIQLVEAMSKLLETMRERLTGEKLYIPKLQMKNRLAKLKMICVSTKKYRTKKACHGKMVNQVAAAKELGVNFYFFRTYVHGKIPMHKVGLTWRYSKKAVESLGRRIG